MNDAWIWAIAVWMIAFAIHSTVSLGVAWLVARRIGERPEHTSPLWKVAALAGLVTATLATAGVVEPWTGHVEVVALPASDEVPARVLAPPEDLPARGPDAVLAPAVIVGADVLPLDPRDRDLEVAATKWSTPSVAAVATTEPATIVPSLQDTAADSDRPALWLRVLVSLWVVAASIAALSVMGALWQLRRRLADRQPAPPALQQLLQQLRARVPGCPEVRLSCSDRVEVPIATGLFRPEIVVPPRVSALPIAAQQTMLAHELAHVLRRDPAWRLVLLVLERVFVFQPLFRLARRRIEHDAEYLCDAWAASHTAAPLELARCLTEIAAWTSTGRRWSIASTMPHPRSILRRRVMRLVADEREHRSGRRSPWILALVGTCVVMPLLVPSFSMAHAASDAVLVDVFAIHDETAVAPIAVVDDGRRIVIVAVPDGTAGPFVITIDAAGDDAADRTRTPSDRRTARAARRAQRREMRRSTSPTPPAVVVIGAPRDPAPVVVYGRGGAGATAPSPVVVIEPPRVPAPPPGASPRPPLPPRAPAAPHAPPAPRRPRSVPEPSALEAPAPPAPPAPPTRPDAPAPPTRPDAPAPPDAPSFAEAPTPPDAPPFADAPALPAPPAPPQRIVGAPPRPPARMSLPRK